MSVKFGLLLKYDIDTIQYFLLYNIYPILKRESANAVPHEEIARPKSPIRGSRRGQPLPSAMQTPHPGSSCYVIHERPTPSKYETRPVTETY